MTTDLAGVFFRRSASVASDLIPFTPLMTYVQRSVSK